MGTFTITASESGFQGDAPYSGYWGYPLEYYHRPYDDTIKYQDVWSGGMSGAFFTLDSMTNFYSNGEAKLYSMQSSSATFYKPTESIDGKPQDAIKIGTATFDNFSWSGSWGYDYGVDGSVIGFSAYLQSTDSSNNTPMAGNAFGGHIASLDFKFIGSNTTDVISGHTLSGIGRTAVFEGNDGDDRIYGSYYASNKIYGGSGADHLEVMTEPAAVDESSTRSQLIDGGDGDDYISIYDSVFGFNQIFGGNGDDYITIGGAGGATVEGGYGDDIISRNSPDLKITAKYSGNRADYAIRVLDQANGIYEVVDIRAGSPDGRDSLSRVDSLGFKDVFLPTFAKTTDKFAIVGTDQGDIIAPEQSGENNYLYNYENIIFAHGGDDFIDGGFGADTMIGGLGNDTYVVDETGDLVVEAAREGTDSVLANISYKLGANVENLTLTGNSQLNATGNALENEIAGNSGANVLNGGIGADTMSGGAGNDTYFVDNAGDRIVEANGGGADRVFTSVSYTLAAGHEIETLATTSAAGTATINLTGNEFSQAISGNAGANAINGKGGADTMVGYGGNDTYYVDDAGDRVIEAAGGGSDHVLASTNYALRVGSEVERLSTTATNGSAAINLTGNQFAQRIDGNQGVNKLYGLDGDDTLVGYGGDDLLFGGAGKDTLNGGQGNDSFWFNTSLNATTNVDAIVDFTNAAGNNDVVHLENAIFAKLTAVGTLNAAFFKANTTGTATDSNDYIVYETDTGKLFYDADGSGAGAAVQFAVLNNKAALTAGDFLVV